MIAAATSLGNQAGITLKVVVLILVAKLSGVVDWGVSLAERLPH